ERSDYAFAISGLAQVKCAQNKYDEAVALLKNAFSTTPEHSFIEELANVYRATEHTTLAEETIERVEKEFADHVKEGWNVDKEYALFCANHEIHLEEALERAQKEYERRPNNIEALDTYAWTLFKNGRAAEAVPYMEKALRMGTKNSAMKYHAGMIYNAAGNKTKAREFLQEAVKINPYITVLYLSNARKTLAELNVMASN
ncbi:MAG: tetratricopeptide repeat protein, partial [Bacteroidota bacterium]